MRSAEARDRPGPRRGRIPLAAGVVFSVLLAAVAGPAEEAVHHLDLAAPSATRVIGPDVAEPRARKLVQIEVTAVDNPERVPIGLDVIRRGPSGEETRLGSVSLFPPDNPGTFVVATGGRLGAGDVVEIRLVVLGDAPADAPIRVDLGPIVLRRE